MPSSMKNPTLASTQPAGGDAWAAVGVSGAHVTLSANLDSDWLVLQVAAAAFSLPANAMVTSIAVTIHSCTVTVLADDATLSVYMVVNDVVNTISVQFDTLWVLNVTKDFVATGNWAHQLPTAAQINGKWGIALEYTGASGGIFTMGGVADITVNYTVGGEATSMRVRLQGRRNRGMNK